MQSSFIFSIIDTKLNQLNLLIKSILTVFLNLIHDHGSFEMYL